MATDPAGGIMSSETMPPPSLKLPRPTKQGQETSTRVFVNALYYPNFLANSYPPPPSSLPLKQLTHVFYRLAQVDTSGMIRLSRPSMDREREVDGTKGYIRALTQLKRGSLGSHLKIVLSVGPTQIEASSNFASVAADPLKAKSFAITAAALIEKYELDGLDMTFIYPNDQEQTRQFVALLARLRVRLPAPRYVLTAGLESQENVLEELDLSEAQDYVNFFNVPSFGFHDLDISGHYAPVISSYERVGNFSTRHMMMPSARGVVEYLQARGVRPEKIALCVSLFGRSSPATRIPGQAASPLFPPRLQSYEKLPLAGMTEQYDERACTAFCVPDEKVGCEDGRFISYDNPRSVLEKARLVRQKGLAGLCFWHATRDSDLSPGRSLIAAGWEGLYSKVPPLKSSSFIEEDNGMN